MVNHDLLQACQDALHYDRRQVRAFAERYTWAAVTAQFVQALRLIRTRQPQAAVPIACA